MERSSFLKRLLGGMAGAAVAPSVAATVRERTVIYRAHLRGMQYHEGEALFPQLRPGDVLDLRREPQNPYDGNAVAVDRRGHHLGYLPARENASLATMLDNGLPLEARIDTLNADAPPWEMCGVVVELVAA